MEIKSKPWVQNPKAGDKIRRVTSDECYVVTSMGKHEFSRAGSWVDCVFYVPVEDHDDIHTMTIESFKRSFEAI
jgi:hypothetical protein